MHHYIFKIKTGCNQVNDWVAPQWFIPPPSHTAAPFTPITVHEERLRVTTPTIPPKPPVTTLVTPTPEELATHHKHCIATDECIPSIGLFKKTIGKKCLMWPRLYALAYPTAPLLMGYAVDGCPIDCGLPWLSEHILLAIHQGPHKSALTKAARQVLREETNEKLR